MKYIVISGIVALAALAYYMIRSKNKSSQSGYFISTSGESQERINALDLGQPSEDSSHILTSVKFSFPEADSTATDDEYKADPETDWAIQLQQPAGGHFTSKDLFTLFDIDWRSNFSSRICGHSTADKKWTHAMSGDSVNYDMVEVVVNLREVFTEETPDFNARKLEKYVDELKKRIAKYPVMVTLSPSEPVDKAIARAKQIVALYHRFSHDAIIVLHNNKPYNGREAWDALLCTGLTWGDGDLFNWANSSDYGHDQHFSVWTTTEPGYFLPEEVKSGRLQPGDLCFGFSIPRSADPKLVFDAMLNTARYCQRRLGGSLLSVDGRPFNEIGERLKLHTLVAEMLQSGLIPGSNKALINFD